MWIIDLLDENRHREASLCEFSMKYFHFIQEFIDSSNRITHQPTHSRLQASVCERSGSWYQSTESTIASNINRCSLGLPIRWLCEEDELYIHFGTTTMMLNLRVSLSVCMLTSMRIFEEWFEVDIAKFRANDIEI